MKTVTGQALDFCDGLPAKRKILKATLPVKVRRKRPNREGNGVVSGEWGDLLIYPRLLPAMELEDKVANRNRTYVRLVEVP